MAANTYTKGALRRAKWKRVRYLYEISGQRVDRRVKKWQAVFDTERERVLPPNGDLYKLWMESTRLRNTLSKYSETLWTRGE